MHYHLEEPGPRAPGAAAPCNRPQTLQEHTRRCEATQGRPRLQGLAGRQPRNADMGPPYQVCTPKVLIHETPPERGRAGLGPPGRAAGLQVRAHTCSLPGG